jgi:hypothetical protein
MVYGFPFAITCMNYRCLALLISLVSATAQSRVPDGFRWVDFKQDVSTVSNIEKALKAENYSAIREIGVRGDFALVMTVQRESTHSTPLGDRWGVYNISTKNWNLQPLISGYNLEIKDWIRFQSNESDLGVFYMDCWECKPAGVFTALHYDTREGWRARWKNEKDPIRPGIVFRITDVNHPYTNEQVDQVVAVIAPSDDVAAVGTWYYSKDLSTGKITEAVTKFSVDQATGEDKTFVLSGPEAKAWELKLCKVPSSPLGLSQGQSSRVCKRITSVRANSRK